MTSLVLFLSKPSNFLIAPFIVPMPIFQEKKLCEHHINSFSLLAGAATYQPLYG